MNGGHLHRRGRFGTFFMYLSLFCSPMLNLILADNLFQIFVSWELVGICSYLLIGFYHERMSASNAANKAFITNRVGDAGFIIGMLILGLRRHVQLRGDLQPAALPGRGQPQQTGVCGPIVRAAPVEPPTTKDDREEYEDRIKRGMLPGAS